MICRNLSLRIVLRDDLGDLLADGVKLRFGEAADFHLNEGIDELGLDVNGVSSYVFIASRCHSVLFLPVWAMMLATE